MWITRWKAINARIHGLRATTTLFFQIVQATAKDYHGVGDSQIIPEAKEILTALVSFRADFADVLPTGALNALDNFLLGTNSLSTRADGAHGVGGLAIALVSLQAMLDHHFAGAESIGRSISERAFEHLQRLIVADEEQRKKWRSALAVGETACEKLGAVHLLMHGIWAFKINAKGERTDLVFGEPLQFGQAERTAPVALVLTEWKVARGPEEVDAKFEEARKQAKLYSGGSLSDLELTAMRFLVVVTEKHGDVQPDLVDGNVRFRRKVIAVNPDWPSVAARSSIKRTLPGDLNSLNSVGEAPNEALRLTKR